MLGDYWLDRTDLEEHAMANFMKPTSGEALALEGWDEAAYKTRIKLGSYQKIWLWGGAPGGGDLAVELEPAFPRLITISEASRPAGNTREFVLSAEMVGCGQLRAYWKTENSRVSYSAPLAIEVVAELQPAGSGRIFRFISSEAGIAGFSAAFVAMFQKPDRVEYATGISYLTNRALILTGLYAPDSAVTYISRLDIVGHGDRDTMTVGKDSMQIGNLGSFAPFFNELSKAFRQNSFCFLMGCGVGENEQFMRRIAGMMGVTVWGGIGDMHTYGTTPSGQYSKCTPQGDYVVVSTRLSS